MKRPWKNEICSSTSGPWHKRYSGLLHLAIVSCNSKLVIRLLRESEATISHETFRVAAKHADVELMGYLHQTLGRTAGNRTKFPKGILVSALRSPRDSEKVLEMVEYLLNLGADPKEFGCDESCDFGFPMKEAVQRLSLLEHDQDNAIIDIMKLLHLHGSPADRPRAGPIHTPSALQVAIYHGSIRAVELLLGWGADVDQDINSSFRDNPYRCRTCRQRHENEWALKRVTVT